MGSEEEGRGRQGRGVAREGREGGRARHGAAAGAQGALLGNARVSLYGEGS